MQLLLFPGFVEAEDEVDKTTVSGEAAKID